MKRVRSVPSRLSQASKSCLRRVASAPARLCDQEVSAAIRDELADTIVDGVVEALPDEGRVIATAVLSSVTEHGIRELSYCVQHAACRLIANAAAALIMQMMTHLSSVAMHVLPPV